LKTAGAGFRFSTPPEFADHDKNIAPGAQAAAETSGNLRLAGHARPVTDGDFTDVDAFFDGGHLHLDIPAKSAILEPETPEGIGVNQAK